MKKYLLILAVLSLLVLSGCNGSSSGNGGDNWKTFIGGTQGVSVSFEQDAPPTEVNAGDSFYVVAILENKGEYTIPATDYTVTLSGVSPIEFGGFTSTEFSVAGTEDLEANQIDSDTGEVLETYPVYVQVPAGDTGLTYDSELAGNQDFNLNVDVCYQYETKAQAQLCIKEELKKSTDTNVCKISDAQKITSSGGPIQITDFRESSGGEGAVRFNFKVVAANTGGEVSEAGSDCNSDYSTKNKVFVTVDTGFPTGLTCQFMEGQQTSGTVQLSSGSRLVRCTQLVDQGLRSDYIKIVQITADYDYEQSGATSVLIKPAQ